MDLKLMGSKAGRRMERPSVVDDEGSVGTHSARPTRTLAVRFGRENFLSSAVISHRQIYLRASN